MEHKMRIKNFSIQYSFNKHTFFFVLVFLLFLGSTAQAGFQLRPINPAYSNEIGLGLSYGIKLSKDAMFWGYSPDYVRVLSSDWLLNISFAYDKETETKESKKEVTETWTPSVMFGYQATPTLAIGLGIGHGLFDNKDGAGWNSVKFGNDLSVAIATAVSLWSDDRNGIAISISLEYNISDNEPSISTDLGYGFSF